MLPCQFLSLYRSSDSFRNSAPSLSSTIHHMLNHCISFSRLRSLVHFVALLTLSADPTPSSVVPDVFTTLHRLPTRHCLAAFLLLFLHRNSSSYFVPSGALHHRFSTSLNRNDGLDSSPPVKFLIFPSFSHKRCHSALLHTLFFTHSSFWNSSPLPSLTRCA